MKKSTSPFDSVTAAVTSRRKATRYVTPNGKERHVAENVRKAFDYLITMWDGTDSSGLINMVQVEEVGVYQANLDYLSGDFFIALTKCPPILFNF
jgi:hypothetical protein